MSTKYLSTTVLSKELGMATKELFEVFDKSGYINRVDNAWVLTDLGKEKGGTIRKHPQHGNYIAWSEKIKSDSIFTQQQNDDEESAKNLLNATKISEHFGISRFRINLSFQR
ncbi:hypothetical protein ACWE42_19325 [Sutcliffiella cohnii]